MSYTPTFLSQQDPSWKNDRLGFSNITIGTDGCLLTAMTMLVVGFGYEETPATLNKKLKNLGTNSGFIGPLVVWGGLPLLFSKIKYKNLVLCPDHDAPLAQIDSALEKGQTVLIEVDRSPASGLQNHWVLIYGKTGNDYLITDPWPYPQEEKEILLTEQYGFQRPLREFITAVAWYEMDGISPPPPTDGFYVQVANAAISGLRIRSEPNTTTSITVGTAEAGSYLRVLENELIAKTKVGVINQWLHIRDSKGVEGYVAAWYVINPNAEGTDDTEEEGEIDTGLKCYVSPSVGASGLSLREYPSSNSTLVDILGASSELTLLDEEDVAKAKIGVAGEWVHVQSRSGHVGYVAAWLVVWSLEDDVDDNVEDEDNVKEMPDHTRVPPFRVRAFPSLGSSGLRMRAEPNLDARIVTILPGGTILTVLEQGAREKVGLVNAWLDVSTPEGITGYVAAWYVEEVADDIIPPDDGKEPPTALIVYVIPLAKNGLRLRTGPSVNHDIVKTLMPNDALTVLDDPQEAIVKIGAQGEWLHVRDKTGAEGYTAAWYLIR